MAVTASVEVYGVKKALKELGDIDKKQRFKAVNKVKAAGNELVQVARSTYPSDPVLVSEAGYVSWSPNGRLGYSKAKVDKGVVIKVGGRSYGNTYAIVTLVQQNPGGALFDIAGFADGSYSKGPQGDAFISKLNRQYGKAQRGMWRRIASIRNIGNDAILKALEEVVAETNRKLVA